MDYHCTFHNYFYHFHFYCILVQDENTFNCATKKTQTMGQKTVKKRLQKIQEKSYLLHLLFQHALNSLSTIHIL